MKVVPLLLALPLLCCAPAFAQTAPAAKPVAASAANLPAWEQLSAAERDMLIGPLRERWNSDPAERPRMMERARRWQLMTPEERADAHRGMRRWDRMSPEQREHMRALFNEMRKLSPEERQALRAKWRAMTPAERDAWLKAHPAPQQ